MPEDFCVVLCSCPAATANDLAASIITKKLAACVNIIPQIQSHYIWQETPTHSEEQLLIIKTTQSLYSELEKVILAMHPYECPEVISLPIQTGSANYLQWLASAVK